MGANCSNMNTTDLIGRKFNRLTVIKFDRVEHKRDSKGKNRDKGYWVCKCDCGKEVSIARNELVGYASKTSNYNLLPNINDFNDMGKYLVNETAHFDDVSLWEDYIDYYKLGKDYTQRGCTYNGKFTEYGYLMEKEDFEKKKEKEEEFEGEW